MLEVIHSFVLTPFAIFCVIVYIRSMKLGNTKNKSIHCLGGVGKESQFHPNTYLNSEWAFFVRA